MIYGPMRTSGTARTTKGVRNAEGRYRISPLVRRTVLANSPKETKGCKGMEAEPLSLHHYRKWYQLTKSTVPIVIRLTKNAITKSFT